MPVALLVGVALAGAVYWYIADQALADDPAPPALWAWITASGLAAVVLALGWRDASWWRRGFSAVAVPLCVLSAALTVNTWVGYYPTVRSAWDGITGAPLPGQTDLAASASAQGRAAALDWTNILSVRIPDRGSGFRHRDELVLLPPAWYASTPPPRLPVLMMIGGEFGAPSAWLDAGDVQSTINDFAAGHGGNAPVVVFPDSTGSFGNDTECVNGPRGNAADHLTKDVVPYMISAFGVSDDPANWGIVGWSSGGTCALTLSVTHPELFSTFVDIDGQAGPDAGTKEQTIDRLFGGDADGWAAFDPATVIAKHGPYSGMSGWFSVSVGTPNVYRAPTVNDPLPAADMSDTVDSEDHAAIANNLCRFASSYGIECAVVSHPGKHDFSSAGSMFATALHWLAGKLGTPGVLKVAMPGGPPVPTQ